MELTIKGGEGTVELADATFARPFSEALVHQVVTAYLAGGRAGTRATRSRSQVAGGGRKPWRQKGTGRARAGTRSSPIWRGGGHTFALKPQDHSKKVNRKQYRAAMQSILSELVRQERLEAVDAFTVAEPKTKLMAEKLAGVNGRVLVILDEVDENVYLAARNLPNVAVVDTAAVDPVTLVGADHVIATVKALKNIEEWLA